MSKDSSATYIHFHQSRLADVFEDFNRPHTALNTNNASSSSNVHHHHHHHANNTNGSGPSLPTSVPSFLPIEDIYVAPQYQPVNPEDEDDVVPDQHAAFGITRAMDSRRQVMWRDLGLEELMRGVRLGVEKEAGGGPRVGGGQRADGGRLGRRVTCLR